MHHLSKKQLQGTDERFEDDVTSCFTYQRSVETTTVKGGMNRRSVEEQIQLIVQVAGAG